MGLVGQEPVEVELVFGREVEPGVAGVPVTLSNGATGRIARSSQASATEGIAARSGSGVPADSVGQVQREVADRWHRPLEPTFGVVLHGGLRCGETGGKSGRSVLVIRRALLWPMP